MNTPRDFKFLVIADGSEESRLAAYFAARRAAHTGAKVLLLAVVEPPGFQHWLGVGEEIRREEAERARDHLDVLAQEVAMETGEAPETLIREGELRAELMALIEQDTAIRILCLGAAPGNSPGPLVSALARGGRGVFGKRAIPVAVLPSAMTREDIADIA